MGIWASYILLSGLLIVFGGYQMLKRRGYGWAVAAALLAIFSCSFVSPPIGIWALIVLSMSDVRAFFGGGGVPGAPARPDHFWRRFAVVVACGVLIPIMLIGLSLAAVAIAVPNFFKSQAEAAPLTAQEQQQAGIRQEGGEFRKDFSRSFPLEATGRFSIDNVNGRTEIHGWSSNLVVVTGTIHGKTSQGVNAIKFNVNSDPSHAEVHTDIPNPWKNIQWNWGWFRDVLGDRATVDYVVHVPQRAQLKDVSSVNGQIKIDGVAGDITASTVNGETDIKNAGGKLKLDTVNGGIKAEMDVLSDGQSVTMDAVNGELELTIPEDANATFTVSTVNGNVTSDFPGLQPKKEFPVGNNLNGSLGHGGAKVKADAVNGTIKILKRPAQREVSSPQNP